MKEITLKIVNSNGHSTLKLSPQMALDRVVAETKENGKWCYVDSEFKSSDTISISDIQEANEIVLVNSLVGGQ